jgi:hypothetical protein
VAYGESAYHSESQARSAASISCTRFQHAINDSRTGPAKPKCIASANLLTKSLRNLNTLLFYQVFELVPKSLSEVIAALAAVFAELATEFGSGMP